MPYALRTLVLVVCLLGLTTASHAEPGPTATQRHAVTLVDTIAARHALPLSGTWEILVPQRVMEADSGDAAVAVTLYALRNGAETLALLQVQRNVLPGVSGWGPPAACDPGDQQTVLSVYQSPRDVLCGWARGVTFSEPGHRTTVGPVALIGLADNADKFAARNNRWMWYGLRISNRSDFLDMQLLIPNQTDIAPATSRQFLADMAHSIEATWLSGSLAAVAPPVEARPAASANQSWWSGTLSTSAMKTATYRVGVSIKTFAVASFMAGNAATGGAIITVLNFTSTGIYLLNDYLWETWRPLMPAPQNFASLVETK